MEGSYTIFYATSFIVIAVIVIILAVFMSCDCVKSKEDCKTQYCHKIKERDYKFCIIILFIVIVFICTLTMGINEKVAEYLSFAGSISSIILSVLAIIMTILAEKKAEIEKIKMDNLVFKMEACTQKTEENLSKIENFESKLDTIIEKEEDLLISQDTIKNILQEYEVNTNNIDKSQNFDKFNLEQFGKNEKSNQELDINS